MPIWAGKFRTAHHRVAQHAEHVAFLHGESYEQRRCALCISCTVPAVIGRGNLGDRVLTECCAVNVVFEAAQQSNQRRENEKAVFHLFQSFLFNRVPFMMQQALRLSWSLGVGTDEVIKLQ